MSGVRWITACCLLMTASVASAETGKPRNILEFLFGQRKVEEPTSIAPPAPSTIAQPAKAKTPAAPAQARQKHEKRPETKAEHKRVKPSIRRTASTQAIDPGNAPQPAPGSYRGPFRGGGNTAYCVRTCDGYFFPINHEGAQGADRYDMACQSSCPGAKTDVYFMKRGGDIKWSSTARGEGYMALENALKYRKERDPACTCKSQEQNWSSILAPVETMMKHAKTDVLITEEASNEIVRGEDPVAIAKKAEQARAEQAKAGQAKAEQTRADEAKAGKDKAAKRETPTAGAASLSGKRADIGSATRTSSLRSSFGERIAPANRFIRIDPEPTGSIPAAAAKPEKPKPETSKPEASKPEASKSTTSKPRAALSPAQKDVPAQKLPARPVAVAPALAAPVKTASLSTSTTSTPDMDRKGLRQTLDRLITSDKR